MLHSYGNCYYLKLKECGCLQNNTVVFGDNAYYNGISLFSFDDENEFIEEMDNA